MRGPCMALLRMSSRGLYYEAFLLAPILLFVNFLRNVWRPDHGEAAETELSKFDKGFEV